MFKSTMSAVLLTAGLSFAIGAQAATVSLSHEMHQLKSGYKAFSKASNAEQALTALTQMQQAAQAAKKASPESVDPSDASQVAAYQNELNQLSSTISAAMDLARANKLAESKALGKKMLQIRDAAHEQFR